MDQAPEKRGDPRYRFGQFDFEATTGRLWRNGLVVRLQGQPGQVLAMLLAADGQVVSREQLQKTLWPDDSYGDFDTGLNTAIKKLRQALDDSAQNPRFVETLPRMGYRFLAPVTRVELAQHAQPYLTPVVESGEAPAEVRLEAGASGQAPAEPGPAALAARTDAHGPDLASSGLSAPPAEFAAGPSKWLRLVAAIAVVVILAAGVAAGRRWVFPARMAGPGPLRLAIALPPDQEVVANLRGRTIALSPDGAEVYYVASVSGTYQIFRRKLTGTDSELIPGTDGATALALSRNGSRLLFHRDGQAWLVDLDGFQARKVAPPDDSWVAQPYFAFGEDGAMFVSGTANSAQVAGERAEPGAGPEPPAQGIYFSADGSQWVLEMPSVVSYELRGGEYQFPLQVLPDGKLLWAAAWAPRERAIYLRDRRTGSNRLLAEPAMNGHITPDGILLHYWQGELRATRLNGGSPGEPTWTIAKDVLVASWGLAQASASDNGNLVYLEAPPLANAQLLWVDEAGRESAIPAPARPYSLLDVSRDGKRLLVGLSESYITRSIWSYHLSNGEWIRLLDDATEPPAAVWSPGGAYAIVNSYSGGLRFPNIMAVLADGRSPLQRIAPSPYGQFPLSWSSANAPLAFVRSEVKETSVDVGLLYPQLEDGHSAPNESEPEPGVAWKQRMLEWPSEQRHPAISPDGKLLAFTQGYAGAREIQVCMLPDCTERVTVPQSQQGHAPLWDETGKVLFFRLGDGVYAARVRTLAADRPVFHAPARLFAGNYLQPNFWNREMLYDSTSRRFLMARRLKPAEPVRQIHVVLNWESLLAESPSKTAGRK
ncbi:MAG: winged helix-turn-helix domain-containing protein [Bryobacterales bacterium]|nr:winged helix-turn-helix domain-containing protein [Bryobacterales bacterium]